MHDNVPDTLDEAHAERTRLVQEVIDIQRQLATRKGEPETDTYRAWRRAALFALGCKQQRMAELKSYVRAMHKDADPLFDLLRRCRDLLVTFRDEDLLDPDEIGLLAELEALKLR